MANYEQLLKEAFHFGTDYRRWGPLFVFQTVLLMIAIVWFLPSFVMLLSATETSAVGGILNALLGLLGLGIVWGLGTLWFSLALTKQAAGTSSWGTSGRFAVRKIPWAILLFILVMVVGTAASLVSAIFILVPLQFAASIVLSVLVGLAFFVAIPSLVVRNTTGIAAFKESISLFRKHKLSVLVGWALITFIGNLITGIVFLIDATVLWQLIAPVFLSLTDPAVMASIFSSVLTNIPLLAVLGIITMIGFSVATAFSLAATTFFYKQLKK
ncbi:MAG: hypothetical protein KKA90_02800 [Nanoarchaeota archaeon]|nr:hypothetical protein [Nanoarchaeota archaeon]